MKQINVYFDDEDYKKLVEAKKDKNWREFILQLIDQES